MSTVFGVACLGAALKRGGGVELCSVAETSGIEGGLQWHRHGTGTTVWIRVWREDRRGFKVKENQLLKQGDQRNSRVDGTGGCGLMVIGDGWY